MFYFRPRGILHGLYVYLYVSNVLILDHSKIVSSIKVEWTILLHTPFYFSYNETIVYFAFYLDHSFLAFPEFLSVFSPLQSFHLFYLLHFLLERLLSSTAFS